MKCRRSTVLYKNELPPKTQKVSQPGGAQTAEPLLPQGFLFTRKGTERVSPKPRGDKAADPRSPSQARARTLGLIHPQLLQKDQGTFSQDLSFTFALKKHLQLLHTTADPREQTLFIAPNQFLGISLANYSVRGSRRACWQEWAGRQAKDGFGEENDPGSISNTLPCFSVSEEDQPRPWTARPPWQADTSSSRTRVLPIRFAAPREYGQRNAGQVQEQEPGGAAQAH